jgi:hypothetical protein
VGDDVVQLTRDPRALAEHRRRLAFCAVALDLAGLLVEAAIERVARAQDPAREGRDAHRDDRHPGGARHEVAGYPLEQRGRREQADCRDDADEQVARQRAQPDQEDADHAQQDSDLRGVEQAAAEDRVDQEEQVDGEQARQGRAPREDEWDRREEREDERDGADAGVVSERRLGELGEREEDGERGQRALGIERAPGGIRESPAAHPRGR